MKRLEIYETVTNEIINHLEKNLEGFKQPWINVDHDNGPARNPSRDDVPYRGINQFILSLKMINSDHTKNQWMTYKQAQGMGGQVRKGEKSMPVTWYSLKYMKKDGGYVGKDRAESMSAAERSSQNIEAIPMLKVYRVFNVSQIDGLDPSFYEVETSEPLQDFEKDDRAEALVKATGAEIREIAGDRAFYSPKDDRIQMPLREQFQGVAEAWYATVLHEVSHWTGAPHRLDRQLKNRFGSAAYAEEELVAELSSAMVCANLGFSKMTTNNAAYIKSWLGALKNDTKFIFKAAASAQRAADFILDKGGYKPANADLEIG